MAEVMVTLKVFPEDPEKLEEIKNSVSSIVEVDKFEEEDIGFGVKALLAHFRTGEEGGLDPIEEKIAALESVSQVQVVRVDRL